MTDEKVKSMMQETENFSENLSAAPKQENTFMCKVCGKEGRATHMSNHVETNHLGGISIPCVFCEKKIQFKKCTGHSQNIEPLKIVSTNATKQWCV